VSEVQPSDILLRCGGRTLLRHGVLAIAGGRRVHSPSYRLMETFTRADAATCATFSDRDGTLRVAEANKVRIEWVDLDADGIRETPVVLLEGSRPNSALRSEELDNAAWVNVTGTPVVTANDATAPDGTTTADKVEDDDAATTEHRGQNVTIANDTSTHCVSAFVRKRTGAPSILLQEFITVGTTVDARILVNPATGAKIATSTVNNGVIDYGPNWWRVWLSAANNGLGNTTLRASVGPAARAPGDVSTTGQDATQLGFNHVWGLQVELNRSFPSSYIKTVGSSVTQAADALSIPYNFGPRDVTIVAHFYRPLWADAAGSIGSSRIAYELASALPSIQLLGQSASRTWQAIVDTATTDSSQTAAIPAGTLLTVVSQFKNLLTAPQAALDTGSGLSAFASAGTPFSAYGNQTLRIGGSGGSEFFGGLVDLKVLAGLRSYAEATVVP
jgi:hypothetical protein